jgi:6-phosphogluconolactonase (cycloisomerase 2 family)
MVYIADEFKEVELGAAGSVSWTVDLSNVTYDSVFLSIGSQDATPQGLAFSNDGTKMFMMGSSSDSIFQYSLSTGFDLSTASYDSVSLSVSSQDSTPKSLRFNSDGTKMYMIGAQTDRIRQYSLSTAFDLSTASYNSVSFHFGQQEPNPEGLAFNNDGTKMYICGLGASRVYEYNLSTGFDISTASYGSVLFSASGQTTEMPSGVSFNTDGTKMYICDPGTDMAFQYALSTGFDLSTASYDNASVALTGATFPTDLTFSADGTKMYVVCLSTDRVYQYSTGL